MNSEMDEKECDACHFKTDKLHECPPAFGSTRENFWFCDLCYGSFSGNSAQYPKVYEDKADIMQHICYVANVILAKLEAK